MAIDVIKRRRGTVYRARIVLPSRKRITKCFNRKVDAVQFEAKVLAEANKYDRLKTEKVRFEDFADSFLKTHCSRLEYTTREKYEIALRLHIKPRFVGRWIHSISNFDVAEYAAEVEAMPVSDSMKYFLFSTFKSLLKKAFEWGHLDHLPGRGTRAPRKAKPRTEFWTAPEIAAFLSAMKDRPRRPLYLLALNTGLRAGEILGLRWDAIDFDRKMIVVKRTYCQKQKIIKETTKTHKERFIAMNEVVYRMLLALRCEARSLELFTPASLDCTDITHLSRVFRMDCKRAGVRVIRFHP